MKKFMMVMVLTATAGALSGCVVEPDPGYGEGPAGYYEYPPYNYYAGGPLVVGENGYYHGHGWYGGHYGWRGDGGGWHGGYHGGGGNAVKLL